MERSWNERVTAKMGRSERGGGGDSGTDKEQEWVDSWTLKSG